MTKPETTMNDAANVPSRSDAPVREEVLRFLSRYFGDDAPDGAADIFKSGYVNSLFVMQLVAFVEKSFDVVVEDDDLKMENFRSVDAICGFVGAKRAGAVA